ncbi:MAG: hypothetical protein SVM80_11240 [Halobacteriota archaeon]|nr:hypothetical protein [Halobacteriota archaeon]
MNIKTSDREIRELLIAWIFISLAFAFALRGMTGSLILSMVLSLVTIGPAFILHELAHKIVAQRYGCWAEFRMSFQMLLFAVFIALLSGIVFAAPGAVMISGYVSKSQNGKISVSGALTNLLLVLVFLPISLRGGFIGLIGYYGAFINALIAAFNMIPFGPLDGRKVLAWDRTVYITVVTMAIGAIILVTGLV